MVKPIRALLLDDEPIFLQVLETQLTSEVEGLVIEKRETPDPSGEFDIYFIDNEFDGVPCAAHLAHEIRAKAPEALVIAFSGTLDAGVLKELLNAGCNGVCDKAVASDLPYALRAARKFAEDRLREATEPAGPVGFLGAIRAISELLKEWNSRLDSQERSLTDKR